MIEIYFDGACEPVNPGGTASYGYLIKRDNQIIERGSGIIGKGEGMTNNVAEYYGLIEGIKALKKLRIEEKVMIYGDSKMVCCIVAKEWGWKKKKTVWMPHETALHLKKLLDEALKYLEGMDYNIQWVTREKNQEADDLSKEPLIKAGIIKSIYPKYNFTKKIDKEKEKHIIKSKIKKKPQEGDACPKNCGGILYWANSKMTPKKMRRIYHFEKWLKCNKCRTVFFDEKYKIIHQNETKSLF
ncbi:MAG: ribonuclease HI family protein [Patescibacteria group bacterium]|nr:ribonuclease HI family protein [Patescibacteria group bacterium]MDD5534931.1 ribonuclease HI family protein [Patescibacteria group bacterium]